MKKTVIAILLAGLALVSCDSGKTPDQSGETNAATESVKVTESEKTTETAVMNTAPYIVAFSDGKTVTLGADPESTLPGLGEYFDMIEAPSCVHEGNDKVYSFNGFSVMTSPDVDGNEYVAQVDITLDVVSLANGITVGSAKADLVEAYGDSFTEQFGMLTYDFGNATLTANLNGDVVAGIVFTAK